ncbi:MAG: hypothetical protein LC776_15850 [Acidobacteria bacterium]|nr:hypothetical protein [Acidobacteriota bacterium]
MRGDACTRRLLSTLHQTIVFRSRPNPIILVWRWRYEIALLTGLPLTLAALVEAIGPNGAVLTATVLTTVLIGWSPARRQLAARAWCIVTPHRLRRGCAQAFICTHRGRLPAILWCAPKLYGEQVLLWCPAGVVAEDFIRARHVLASACYAAEIAVVTHPKYRHLVILGVIRC